VSATRQLALDRTPSRRPAAPPPDDEVGLLLEHEPIRRFRIRLARRIRKYGGSLILVTRTPATFSRPKTAPCSQRMPAFFCSVPEASEPMKLQKAFNLTERQVNYWRRPNAATFCWSQDRIVVPVHVMVPPWMDG